MEARTLYDIYRCPHCEFIAANGDIYCRGCGARFSEGDIVSMKNNIHSPIGALPWNTRDRFRCVHCDRFISIEDSYCRGCGDEIEDHERQLMRIRISELAKQNTPSIIGLAVFVLLVILISSAMVK